MKNTSLFLIISFSLFLSTFLLPTNSKADGPQREFRGVWIASVSNINWPSKKGLPVEEQKKELIDMLDMATAAHLNVIVLQVRPEADALYDSKLEPWSQYITGTQGKAPEPYYDPLAFAVEECHKRCLELHAWFNPYRAAANSKIEFAPNHISNTNPDLVYHYGHYLWMDPGRKEVQQHTLQVILDVVKRYDIDGVHMDDYFYPYVVKDENNKDIPFPDEKTYAANTENGGKMDLADWRRDNVNTLIKELYEGIKKEKPWVKFGLSPFGIWQPGNPPGIEGLNSYDVLYCDPVEWLKEGWLDYLAPQLYWAILPPKQSFPKLLKWWIEQNPRNLIICPGMNDERVGTRDRSWNASEIIDQINLTRELGAQGDIHWSIRPLMRNVAGLRDELVKKVYKDVAIVPSMPWLNSTPPKPPASFTVADASRNKILFRWEASDDTTTWEWALYRKPAKGSWELITLLPGSENSYFYNLPDFPDSSVTYGITALDRYANESEKVEGKL